MGDILEALSREDMERAEERRMPEWMEPMLAKLTHDPFSDDSWVYERKLDGERALCYLERDGSTRIMSRNGKRTNDSYPEIERVLGIQAPKDCIVDGEMVAFGSDGTSDFQKLQPRMQASSREAAGKEAVRVYYYIFDLLYIDGSDITGCSLRGRKRLLRMALDWSDPLRFTPHRNGSGLEYYREACGKGWEGVIAKKADAQYVHGRSANWLKFKCVLRQEFVIGGYTDPGGERRGFGALLIGFHSDGRLVYAGKVGTGFDDETLENLGRTLGDIRRKTSPFAGEVREDGVHFVTPELVCQVAFTGWTSGHKLRHPAYRGLRRDKDPGDVVREDAEAVAEPPSGRTGG
ncbi:MAG: hypothetical protein AVO35_11725 [Candidatus Aegiribacteria sp. MLS_C]|nr:MAG: hypothetical protein AVO35_11725 [Candidatus Aegiribacteria sp. MLS_C]